MSAGGCLVNRKYQVFVALPVDVQHVHIECLFGVVMNPDIAAGVSFHLVLDFESRVA